MLDSLNKRADNQVGVRPGYFCRRKIQKRVAQDTDLNHLYGGVAVVDKAVLVLPQAVPVSQSVIASQEKVV